MMVSIKFQLKNIVKRWQKTQFLAVVLEPFCDAMFVWNIQNGALLSRNVNKNNGLSNQIAVSDSIVWKWRSTCCCFARLKWNFYYSADTFMNYVDEFNNKIMVGDLVFTLHISYNHKRISTSKSRISVHRSRGEQGLVTWW